MNAGGLCPIRARASIEFWQIDELMLGKNKKFFFKHINLYLDPCCALKYYPSIEECEKVLRRKIRNGSSLDYL